MIGVHTPEFAFEKNLENVRRAVQQLKIDYPIAIDNDYAIWRAFNNRYWPALYFVDARGRLRHHHFGEGEYEPSEMTIQRLLAEAGVIERRPGRRVGRLASGFEAAADWENLKSPEMYLGYDRTDELLVARRRRTRQPRVYAAPARLEAESMGPCRRVDGGRSSRAILNRDPAESCADFTHATSTW